MKQYRRIVLLDLDGTLINEKYEFTAPQEQISTAIQRLQDDYTLVGLNSDTPIDPLRIWAQRIGISGPLIGEKGQILFTSIQTPPEILGTMANFFQNLKQQVVMRVHTGQPEAFIGIGDATEFVSRRGKIFGEHKIAILINGYRKCSFSAFAMGIKNNNLEKDLNIFDSFTKLVLSIDNADNKRLDIDKNNKYGLLILHEKGASKILALKRLIEKMGTDIEYVMIGDSDSDIIITHHPVKLCAVGNATNTLKDMAIKTGGIVANNTFTEGVIEILQRL